MTRDEYLLSVLVSSILDAGGIFEPTKVHK